MSLGLSHAAGIYLRRVFCGLKRWQNVAELEFVVVLLPALHHQLISVRLAVAVSVVHVLRVRAGVREPLQALAALKRLLSRMQSLVFGLKQKKRLIDYFVAK